jgi:hypothetical protein
MAASWKPFVLSIAAFGAMACAIGSQANREMPVLSVQIGDTVEDVQRRSTVPLLIGDGPITRHLVQVPHEFDFHFRYKGRELVIPGVGGEDLFTALQFTDGDYTAGRGRLGAISLDARRGLLTLDEAFEAARELRPWFESNGFVPMPCPPKEACGIFSARGIGGTVRQPINDYEAARRAWHDTSFKIHEMSLLSMNGDGIGAQLMLLNRRRMLNVGRPSDESNVDGERQYALELNIGSEISESPGNLRQTAQRQPTPH